MCVWFSEEGEDRRLSRGLMGGLYCMGQCRREDGLAQSCGAGTGK